METDNAFAWERCSQGAAASSWVYVLETQYKLLSTMHYHLLFLKSLWLLI